MKSQAELCLSCIVVLAILQLTSATNWCTCELVIALPNIHRIKVNVEPVPSWKRGAEILDGAQLDLKQISNTSECKLYLTKVNIGQCGAPNNFNLLVTIVEQFLTNNNASYHQCLEIPIIGLSCNRISQVAVPLAKLTSHQLITESLNKIAQNLMPTRLRQGATPLIRALFKFMESLDWHKLGILTETGSTYFSRMAEEVYIKAKNDSSSWVLMSRHIGKFRQMRR